MTYGVVTVMVDREVRDAMLFAGGKTDFNEACRVLLEEALFERGEESPFKQSDLEPQNLAALQTEINAARETRRGHLARVYPWAVDGDYPSLGLGD
jgi:hypothetical protein